MFKSAVLPNTLPISLLKRARGAFAMPKCECVILVSSFPCKSLKTSVAIFCGFCCFCCCLNLLQRKDKLAPVEMVRRTLELVRKARFWPSRASSREIDSTSPDATADGRDRRRAHETHLERRGSLQSDEMTTNRARARTSSALIGSAWSDSGQVARAHRRSI